MHSEVVVKRHGFVRWTKMQGNDPAEVAALVALVEGAPMAARAWLDPSDWGTAEASFVNRHGIVLGRRPPRAGAGAAGASAGAAGTSAGAAGTSAGAAGTSLVEPVAKVVVYVTSGNKLLVFRHPESPEVGLQVPAGTIEPGEAPEAAALREASEESGLDLAGPARSLGVREVDMAPFGGSGWVRRHFYHVEAAAAVPDRWRHTEVTPSTGGAAVPLELFWVDADHVPPLAADQGAMLDSLPAEEDRTWR
jgi:8-oxo-dGTP pyrophosphatase MutT (NUDIX family)